MNFRRRRGALDGRLAHNELAQSAMAHQRCDVDPQVTAERVEVFPERSKAPLHSGLQSGERNRFDPLEAFQYDLAILFFTGRQRQPAISRYDSCDTVVTGRSS
jgi:hypothetical protein